jgi:hypothetical protein
MRDVYTILVGETHARNHMGYLGKDEGSGIKLLTGAR